MRSSALYFFFHRFMHANLSLFRKILLRPSCWVGVTFMIKSGRLNEFENSLMCSVLGVISVLWMYQQKYATLRDQRSEVMATRK